MIPAFDAIRRIVAARIPDVVLRRRLEDAEVHVRDDAENRVARECVRQRSVVKPLAVSVTGIADSATAGSPA